jgi:Zn-dependent peptidase ImmA (M78 family)
MKVKYLVEEEIEAKANFLLQAYENQFDSPVSLPIPIDEIAECCLELDLRFGNLEEKLQKQGILGAIWMEDKKIVIDECLDPSTYPLQIGRYKFTLGHEVGHWSLHREYYLARTSQFELFKANDEPSIICRSGDSAPIEWQANAFAACILMPKEIVRKAWEEHQGSFKAYNASDEVAEISSKRSLSEDQTPIVKISKDLAQKFQVSAQAMQIRLAGLGLIKFHRETLALFE